MVKEKKRNNTVVLILNQKNSNFIENDFLIIEEWGKKLIACCKNLI